MFLYQRFIIFCFILFLALVSNAMKKNRQEIPWHYMTCQPLQWTSSKIFFILSNRVRITKLQFTPLHLSKKRLFLFCHRHPLRHYPRDLYRLKKKRFSFISSLSADSSIPWRWQGTGLSSRHSDTIFFYKNVIFFKASKRDRDSYWKDNYNVLNFRAFWSLDVLIN